MAALANHVDLEAVARSERRTRANAERARGKRPPDVLTEAGINTFEQAVANHRGRAGTDLFSRLESENDAALQAVLDVVEDLRRGEKHRDVAIVAAGVHHPGLFRRKGQSRIFRNGKTVDIAAQHDRATGFGPFDHGHRAGLHAALAPLDAHLVKFFANLGSRFEFLFARFRMTMEPAAHFDLIVAVLLHERFDVHRIFLICGCSNGQHTPRRPHFSCSVQ